MNVPCTMSLTLYQLFTIDGKNISNLLRSELADRRQLLMFVLSPDVNVCHSYRWVRTIPVVDWEGRGRK